MQYADDGYSRCKNIGGSLVRNIVFIYLPDDSKSGRDFEGMGRGKS